MMNAIVAGIRSRGALQLSTAAATTSQRSVKEAVTHIRMKVWTQSTMVTLAVASAVLLSGGTPVEASKPPRMLTSYGSNTFQIRPSMIMFSGNGYNFMGKPPWDRRKGTMRWKKWNSRKAVGVGSIWYRACSQGNCGPVSRPGTVRASRPSGGRFTQLTVTYRSGGRTITFHKHLHRDEFGSGYVWQ